jgi:hypothetical protein
MDAVVEASLIWSAIARAEVQSAAPNSSFERSKFKARRSRAIDSVSVRLCLCACACVCVCVCVCVCLSVSPSLPLSLSLLSRRFAGSNRLYRIRTARTCSPLMEPFISRRSPHWPSTRAPPGSPAGRRPPALSSIPRGVGILPWAGSVAGQRA